MDILVFRNMSLFKSFFVVVNVGCEMENVNLRKVQRFLSSNVTARVASLYAEQYIGYGISTI